MPNVLLVWPRFPTSFWSFEAALDLVDKRALVSPLGLITVAGQFPDDWTARLVDCNTRPLTEKDWAWADVVFLSAMIVQKDHFAQVIAQANNRQLPVVVGGPYVTSLPDEAEAAGADYIVGDEAEISFSGFLTDFTEHPVWRRAEGDTARRYTANGAKPALSDTVMPRFELLEFSAYDIVSVQYSRGCPFLCEFCDIITLYGRVPRTKPVPKMIAELQRLFDLGWRGDVFLVDDNFIGNKKNVKALLTELVAWQYDHGHPFSFLTEASVDLAADQDLVGLMVQAGFNWVFLGIETPDADSLELTRKHQNNRAPMSASVDVLQKRGLGVMAGFIIGFDGEKRGAGDRVVEFVERTHISHAFLNMLQVLPNTGLYTRLEKEGRLLDSAGTINQTQLLNFVPTRPIDEIAQEYLSALRDLYHAGQFARRAARAVLIFASDPPPAWEPDDARPPAPSSRPKPTWADIRVLLRAAIIVLVRNGIVRSTRWMFWRAFCTVLLRRPGQLDRFLEIMAHNEHFTQLLDQTERDIRDQLARVPQSMGTATRTPPTLRRTRSVQHLST